MLKIANFDCIDALVELWRWGVNFNFVFQVHHCRRQRRRRRHRRQRRRRQCRQLQKTFLVYDSGL